MEFIKCIRIYVSVQEWDFKSFEIWISDVYEEKKNHERMCTV